MATPLFVFPETTLRCVAVDPPTVVLDPAAKTPVPLGMAAVPAAVSPTMFPWTIVPDVEVPSTNTPDEAFPDATFPPFAPGVEVAAPIVVLVGPVTTCTPLAPFETATEPLMSVPM